MCWIVIYGSPYHIHLCLYLVCKRGRKEDSVTLLYLICFRIILWPFWRNLRFLSQIIEYMEAFHPSSRLSITSFTAWTSIYELNDDPYEKFSFIAWKKKIPYYDLDIRHYFSAQNWGLKFTHLNPRPYVNWGDERFLQNTLFSTFQRILKIF